MKTHLTTEDIYDMAYAKLDVSNIKVDKEQELAEILDLEWDEKVGAYWNPDYINSIIGKLDRHMTEKEKISHGICVSPLTVERCPFCTDTCDAWRNKLNFQSLINIFNLNKDQ